MIKYCILIIGIIVSHGEVAICYSQNAIYTDSIEFKTKTLNHINLFVIEQNFVIYNKDSFNYIYPSTDTLKTNSIVRNFDLSTLEKQKNYFEVNDKSRREFSMQKYLIIRPGESFSIKYIILCKDKEKIPKRFAINIFDCLIKDTTGKLTYNLNLFETGKISWYNCLFSDFNFISNNYILFGESYSANLKKRKIKLIKRYIVQRKGLSEPFLN